MTYSLRCNKELKTLLDPFVCLLVCLFWLTPKTAEPIITGFSLTQHKEKFLIFEPLYWQVFKFLVSIKMKLNVLLIFLISQISEIVLR